MSISTTQDTRLTPLMAELGWDEWNRLSRMLPGRLPTPREIRETGTALRSVQEDREEPYLPDREGFGEALTRVHAHGWRSRDGLTIAGGERDGWHVSRGARVVFSTYGPALDAAAVLAQYRAHVADSLADSSAEGGDDGPER